MLKSSYADATVVTIYLPPPAYVKVRPVLERGLKPGTRVVSHDTAMPGWLWEQTATVLADGTAHNVFLYLIPDAFRKN